MQRSESRILTTHTGTLPRPEHLVELIYAREDAQAVDQEQFDSTVRAAIDGVVAKQVEAGVDIVSDGEFSKIAFNRYAKDRLTGLGRPGLRGATRDGKSFQQRYGNLDRRDHPDLATVVVAQSSRFNEWPVNDGPISYKGTDPVQYDIANFKAAMSAQHPTGGFMTSAAPGALTTLFGEEYYPSYSDYVFAVADAMKVEYKAIVDAGLVLQLDSPDLAMERQMKFSDGSNDDFRDIVALHVGAVNRAIAGLPAEQIRLHVCWGNYIGPHTNDIPLKEILDLLLKAKVGALSIEAANPRHEHEWHIFEQVKLPAGMVLIPGVIDSCTNYVEHPELVAERITRLAKLVGRENIIASSDCGFGTFARTVGNIAPSIVWKKLESMAEGARIATKELF